MKPLAELFRSKVGRALLAVIGLALIGVLLAQAGVAEVGHAVKIALPSLVLVLIAEAGIIVLDALALERLYRAPRPGFWEFLRITIAGYPLAALAPAGRTVAEGVKAAVLARRTSPAQATVAAARMQAVLLLANALASVPAIGVAFVAEDATIVAWAVLINVVVMSSLGFGILLAGRGLGVGALLGKRWGKAKTVGPEVDALWRSEPFIPWSAFFIECGARLLSLFQLAALLAAFGEIDLHRVLLAQGLFAVGTSVGDLLPAQLGATEANFVFAASAIGLSSGQAFAIPMLIRAAQLSWAAVGLILPLLRSKVVQTVEERS